MKRPVPRVVDGWCPLGPAGARTDDEFFEALCAAVFQARFRPAVVRARWPALRLAFAGFRLSEVARWPEAQAARLLRAPGMIRSPKKIAACLRNARELCHRARLHGGVGAYFDSFAPDLEALVAELDTWARYVGAPSLRWFVACAGVAGRWSRAGAFALRSLESQAPPTR